MSESTPSIVVKFFAPHLLHTLELNYLFFKLLQEVPACHSILFEEMDAAEKAESLERVDGSDTVQRRLRIYLDANGERERREDWEEDVERNSP